MQHEVNKELETSKHFYDVVISEDMFVWNLLGA